MSWAQMADRMLGVVVRTFAHVDPAGLSLVQYLPKSGAPYPIRAIFDQSHIEVDPNTGVAVSSANPVLGIQLSQLQGKPQKGDRVSIGGSLYNVADYRPDGEAGALLELHEA